MVAFGGFLLFRFYMVEHQGVPRLPHALVVVASAGYNLTEAART
jgi:hypothetical protein